MNVTSKIPTSVTAPTKKTLMYLHLSVTHQIFCLISTYQPVWLRWQKLQQSRAWQQDTGSLWGPNNMNGPSANYIFYSFICRHYRSNMHFEIHPKAVTHL